MNFGVVSGHFWIFISFLVLELESWGSFVLQRCRPNFFDGDFPENPIFSVWEVLLGVGADEVGLNFPFFMYFFFFSRVFFALLLF